MESMGRTPLLNNNNNLASSSNNANNNNTNRKVFNSPAVAIASFLFAAAQNEIAMVQNLIDEETVTVNDSDYDKRTALHVAASEGHVEVVRLLIREGADVNFADRYNSTPLDDAIHHGHQDVARVLVEAGAKHGKGSNFALDLVHAAGSGDLKTVQRLIDHGIPISSSDYDLRTPLHVAIAGRHLEVVKFLLDRGADLNAEDRFGGTPLEEAHRAGVRLGEDPVLNIVADFAGSKEHHPWKTSFTNSFVITFVIIEIIIGVLYAIFSEYGQGATTGAPIAAFMDDIAKHPYFMDVHVMIFIGFGFLMTFLRKYGYTAVGATFILGALALQFYQLTITFWEDVIEGEWHRVHINITTLIKGDFAGGAVMISFGALLGKVTFTQMMLLSLIEIIFFSLNEAISLKLGIADIGGSMVIHMFGAFFGLAASAFLTDKKARGNRDNSAVYHSDIFSMIGTIFLWMYWPSFNGALSYGNAQHRAVVNTVLSLTASCIFAFIFSQFWRREKVFNMIDIQNATLAGGVAMGTCADMGIHPAFALLVGAISGTISVFGFAILQGTLENRFRLHDTCGVLNLHGIPGLIGGFAGVIVTAAYGGGNDYDPSQKEFIYSHPDRSQSHQAKIQLAFIFITLGISIASGAFGGFLLFWLPKPKKFFLDSTSFETPSREVPYFFDLRGEARHSSENTADTPSVVPAIVPAQGATPAVTDQVISDLQTKIAQLENAMRSQRKTLRDQARAMEGISGSGSRPARGLPTDESSSILGSQGLSRNESMREMTTNANLANMIENLTSKVSYLIKHKKK